MSTLERLVQEARMLPPAEQQRLIEMLSETEPPKSVMTEEEFQAHLLRASVISDLPTPLADRPAPTSFRPIEVQGKPLSETIIEERG